MKTDVVILGSARTAMGGLQGMFSAATAQQLGAAAIMAARERSAINGFAVNDVYMGCVLPAGLGQAPARQATLAAGLSENVPCTTVNKMCGSGMIAVMLGHDSIKARPKDIIVAGGMESMTNAPYLLPKARGGMRMGHGVVQDSMFLDGLEDAYEKGRLMGTFAEDAAGEYQFSRSEQDDFAIASLERARAAITNGAFAKEIAGVTVSDRKGDRLVLIDEQPGNANAAKIPSLKPAFRPGGTVTAANSSSISDGAAALMMTSAENARFLGLKAKARIVATARFAGSPAQFPSAPVPAIKQVLQDAEWGTKDVDLFEVNEAFAVVPMIAMKELGIPHSKMNVNGGACALGHPIGASGARIIVTMLHALEQRGLKRGVAGICIGGGEGTAVAVELI